MFKDNNKYTRMTSMIVIVIPIILDDLLMIQCVPDRSSGGWKSEDGNKSNHSRRVRDKCKHVNKR